MTLTDWLANNWIEVFGAVTGIIYVFFEIKQILWLWPVGIVTSAVYIIVFFASKLYADMSLQGYYLVISILGWYWWIRGSGFWDRGSGHRYGDKDQGSPGTGYKAEAADLKLQIETDEGLHADPSFGQDMSDARLQVTRLKFKTGLVLSVIFLVIYFLIWFALSKLTDSPVPAWDSFITSLSIIATWMLTRKIYEHWHLWIVVNSVSSGLFIVKGLYPTVILYLVYLIMSFAGLREWKRSLQVIAE